MLFRTIALICAALATTFSSTMLYGQNASQAGSAPLPSLLLNGKAVFISYAGQESNPDAGDYSGGSSRTYSEFYSAMKGWGHYELVRSPAECDLVFEIGFRDPISLKDVINGHSIGPNDQPQFRLVVLDPKTHVILWAFTEYVERAYLKGNRDKNFEQGLAAIVADVKSLAAAAAAQAQKQ